MRSIQVQAVRTTLAQAPVDRALPVKEKTSGRIVAIIRHWPLLLLCATFTISAVFWRMNDQRLPDWDASGHILNALQFKELFGHPHLFRPDWWTKLLSVNMFYPPAVYVVNGGLKLLLGSASWVDTLSQCLYITLATASTYGITYLISRSRLASSIAALYINCVPLNMAWCHTGMLDFPLEAAVALALFSLLLWRQKKDIPTTMFLSFCLAQAVMTKQIAAAYLLLPCLFTAGQSLLSGGKERWSACLKLTLAGALATAVAIPWVLVNAPAIHHYTTFSMDTLGRGRLTFASVLSFYLEAIPAALSPLLLVTALSSVPFLWRRRPHQALTLLLLSALGGVLMISCLNWTLPVSRYLMPALVLPAVMTGLLAQALGQWRRTGPLAASLIGILVLAQFLLFSLVSTPPARGFLPQLKSACLMGLTGSQQLLEQSAPFPKDWGQRFVLQTIEKTHPQSFDFLCVVPCSRDLNVHTFEFANSDMGLHIRPTSPRSWTQLGDTFTFNTESARYYQWYLLKSGSLGFKLKDAQSTANLEKLLTYVRQSGHCSLVAERELPDGSRLELYRQR